MNHLNVIPYFLVIIGECIDATDISSGISLTERLSAVVRVFKEQNSVSIRNDASVSLWR